MSTCKLQHHHLPGHHVQQGGEGSFSRCKPLDWSTEVKLNIHLIDKSLKQWFYFFAFSFSQTLPVPSDERLKAQKQALPRGTQPQGWQMEEKEGLQCTELISASWVMLCSGQRAARTTVTPSWSLWMFNALLFRTDCFRLENQTDALFKFYGKCEILWQISQLWVNREWVQQKLREFITVVRADIFLQTRVWETPCRKETWMVFWQQQGARKSASITCCAPLCVISDNHATALHH